ncbi:MAG: hypothetical protein FJX75_18835, partial [Armatimonadetes bacterium]|nr:hypothetical protein [Armatimonadota bacterium]
MPPTERTGADALRFAEAELTERIHWFIRMRWLAAIGVVVGTLAGRYALFVPIDVAGLLAVALAIVGCNLAFTAWDQKLSARGRESIAFAQARLFANV